MEKITVAVILTRGGMGPVPGFLGLGPKKYVGKERAKWLWRGGASSRPLAPQGFRLPKVYHSFGGGCTPMASQTYPGRRLIKP